MLSIFQRVFKFNQDAGTPVLQESLDQATSENEYNMLQEEVDELYMALRANDRVEIADALADIIYVAMGTMAKLGIPYEQVMDEVCLSNETKYTDGVLVKNEAGKIQKGPNFRKPDLSFVTSPSISPLSSESLVESVLTPPVMSGSLTLQKPIDVTPGPRTIQLSTTVKTKED